VARVERGRRLLAGAARTDITPPVGGLLQSGALGVRSQGVLDRLFATAVVLDDGATRLVLVGCDVMDFEAPLAARVRRAVEARTGIPGGHVLLNASHTHSGPAVYLSESPDSPFLTPADREYVDWLVKRVVDTVAQALAVGRPATLRLGSAEGAFAANRRGVNPDGSVGPSHTGAVDHRVRVLCFDDSDGVSLAILFSYACHPTGFDYRRTRLITGDYVSAARAVPST
jgi:neutral ceramidase